MLYALRVFAVVHYPNLALSTSSPPVNTAAPPVGAGAAPYLR